MRCSLPLTAALIEGVHGVGHAEELVVLGDDLDQPALALVEDGEVLNQIEEPGLLASAKYQSLKGYDARLTLAVDPLPLGEMFPARRHGAELRLAAVGQDDQGVARATALRDALDKIR